MDHPLGDFPSIKTTTANSSLTMYRGAIAGNMVEGVPPVALMISAFARIVDYRTYMLRDTVTLLSSAEGLNIYNLKRKVHGSHPTLRVFKGESSITLLPFLDTMTDALDTSRATPTSGI